MLTKRRTPKKTSAKKTSAKKTSAKKTPAKKTPAKKTPATSDSFATLFGERFGFSLPSAYARALADGRLSYRMDLKKQRFTSYREDPPLLICSPRVEWMTPEEILKYELPDYFVSDPQLVCFARGAAGEYWCFVPDWADGEDVPIAFIESDSDDAELVAPDFEGLVFSEIVESMAEWESWVNGFNKLKVPTDELAEFAKKVIATSTSYLKPEHLEALEDLAARPLSGEGTFLSLSEANESIETHLDYPRRGEAFQAHGD